MALKICLYRRILTLLCIFRLTLISNQKNNEYIFSNLIVQQKRKSLLATINPFMNRQGYLYSTGNQLSIISNYNFCIGSKIQVLMPFFLLGFDFIINFFNKINIFKRKMFLRTKGHSLAHTQKDLDRLMVTNLVSVYFKL